MAGVHNKGGDVLVVLLGYCSGEEAPREVFAGLSCSSHLVVDDGLNLGAAAGVVEMVLPGVLECQASVPVGGIIPGTIGTEGATLVL